MVLFNQFKPNYKDINALNKLYARFAEKWHSAVLKLGYLDAYRFLVQHYQERSLPVTNHVLDVGTGTGALAMAFTEAFPATKQLSLLDASPEMLKEAQTNLSHITCRLTTIEGLIGTEKINTASVDTLLCAHVIEHTPDPLASLEWFHQVLKPNGILLLSASKPHWCTALVRWRWGHKAFAPNQVCDMLIQAGFTDVTPISYRSGPASRMSSGFYARKQQ
ncbi:class I SAM-dependent methyltransferase [Marinomonas agarivorans]|nr:class I SAM-dependent methyltransferase [Marinomonas agarivorans]